MNARGASRLRAFAARLRGLLRGPRRDEQFDDEIQEHLRLLEDRFVARGMSKGEAALAARRQFGNTTRLREDRRALQTFPSIESLWQDVRYALRTIRLTPGLTAMAVISLALGIGANTAIFTLINAVMLRSLPVRSPQELVTVGDASRPTALWQGGPLIDVLSYPIYERLRDGNDVFTGLLATGRTGRIEMTVDGGFEEARGRFVSSNYFDVLGITPAIGRTFSPEEGRAPGDSPVVVISYAFWERRFAGDPRVLGRTVRLNGAPLAIIGVGPRDFTGEVVGSPSDIWIPLMMQPQVNPGRSRLDRRDSNWLLGLGRLKPGVTTEMARAQLNVLAHEALAEFLGANASADARREVQSKSLQVEPGARGFSWIRKNVWPMLFTLMGVVGLVLVIACANVANLLLARATSRQREISVRLAMGASRGRLVRQLLTEGGVLALIAGAAGLLLAGWGSLLLSRLAARGGPNPVPFDVDVQPDLPVLLFTVSVSIVTAILFGLVPAVRSTSVELFATLKDTSRSLDRGAVPLGKILVVGQIALSLPLLIGAGLFIRSLVNLESLDVGYSRDNLVLLKVDLVGSGYATPPQQLSQVSILLDRLRTVPGVTAITVSENGLFSGVDSGTESLRVDGFEPVRREDSRATFDQVGPQYFRALGVPVLAGRDFDERDTARTQKVAVINETMGRFYFSKSDPIGKAIRNSGDTYAIVGVVKDSKQRDLKGTNERRFYISMLQDEGGVASPNFEIRTRDDAAAMIPAIRRELELLDPDLKVSSLDTVRNLMGQSISQERSIALLSGFFGVLALFLAAAGLYGVLSYATSRRTNEIGLRMALGAGRGTVIRMILRETLVLMAVGFAIGLPATLVATRLASATLVGVSTADPAIAGGAVLVMLMAGACAGFIPAVRAARIDPMRALRQE